jgi:hypothetical protein
MKFISTRIIKADVKRLVSFYEMVTGVGGIWGNEAPSSSSSSTT